MPRIDLSALPPPEAICFACERTVQLDRRARRAGKFRCPHCRADNKVGPDGLGQPLDNLAERVDQMPRTRCQCGVENRLPRAIIAAGRYTCWECKHVRAVPRTLRKRAGFMSRALILSSLLVFACAVGWSGYRIWRTFREFGNVFADSSTANYNAATAIQLDGAEGLPRTAQGLPVELRFRITNQMDRPLTFYAQGEIYSDNQLVASNILTVRLLKPGEVRRLTMRVYVRRPVNAATGGANVQILGVS